MIRLPSSHRVAKHKTYFWYAGNGGEVVALTPLRWGQIFFLTESSSPTVNSFTSAGRHLFCEDSSLRWAMRAPTPCEYSRSTYDSFLIQLGWLYGVNNNALYVPVAKPRQGHHILH
jgi:hypothetical protein